MIYAGIGIIICALAIGLFYKKSKEKRNSTLPKKMPIQEIRRK